MKPNAASIATLLFAMMGIATASDTLPSSTIIEELDLFGRTLAEEKCRNPKQVAVETVPNSYENVIDEIKTLQCPGYRLVVYEAHASNVVRELPVKVYLTRSVPGLRSKLSIGASVSTVRSLLGEPYTANQEEITYSTSVERPGEDTVTFRISKSKVVRITWSWEVD